MKIIKIKDHDKEGGMTAAEADKELKKRGLKPPTPQEWLELSDDEMNEYSTYTPVYLGKLKNGLLARGYYGFYNYDRRGVYAVNQPSIRFGVLGVKKED